MIEPRFIHMTRAPEFRALKGQIVDDHDYKGVRLHGRVMEVLDAGVILALVRLDVPIDAVYTAPETEDGAVTCL